MVETASGPKVTVCMANYNGAAFIGEALASALEQTLANIEVIVVDDASTDDSVALAQAVAARDGRVRVERLARNGGPSAARNRVLELARGEWIAVLDSDDLMNPLRLQQLVDQAEATSADIIADDLLVFQQDGSSPPRTLLGGWTGDAGGWVSAADYIRSNGPYGHKPNLGFLKPLFRRSFLVAKALTYDISVRIGEDFDIVCRALLDGARMRILPRPYYLYRKHGASISQVMKVSHIQDMLSICDARRSLAQAAPRRRRRRSAAPSPTIACPC
ncbi:MAG: glycosyltransferase family 2 protein [Caulobacteraceae bacterium]